MKIVFLVLLTLLAPVYAAISPEADKPSSSENGFAMKHTTPVPPGFTCSNGWRITGYFTPIESDYHSAEVREVEINGVGKQSFNAEFLRVVFDESQGFGEGWGKTRFGWYLGNYNNQWHKSSEPLDANDTVLKANSVAVDNALIPNDSKVRIPGLPGESGNVMYIANDVGVTVHGKHIDVYTGEGKAAERAMYAVTFEDRSDLQRVCYQAPDSR
ncbi:MAG: 3D domain-containing protein [Pyrinomonadaceae bacterium]